MSRFSHLEIDMPLALETEDDTPQIRDEHYYLTEAAGCYDTGDYEGALLMYSRVLRYDANSDQAWSGQVRSLIELGELDEALLWADKGLTRLPNSAKLLAAKAVALGRKGDLEQAHEFSDASLQQKNGSSYVWAARADVLLAARQKGARYCVEKALEVNPTDASVRLQLALSLLTHGEPVQATRYLRQAENLAPENPYVFCLLGQAHHDEGDREAARRCYGRALSLAPKSKAAEAGLRELDGEGVFARLFRRRRRRR